MEIFRNWLMEREQLQQPDVMSLRKILNSMMIKDQSYANPVERKQFLQQAWKFISKNMDAIMSDLGDAGDGSCLTEPCPASYCAFVLAIHMDPFPEYQKAFFQRMPTNHKKYGSLRLRIALNDKIREFASQGLYGCNDPRFNGDPVSAVRDAKLFPNKMNGQYPKSKAEAEQLAAQTGNTCLLAAAKAVGGGISYTS